MFTEQARKAIGRAQDEAREMGHESVQVEHLLLGLFSDQAGIPVVCSRTSGSRSSRFVTWFESGFALRDQEARLPIELPGIGCEANGGIAARWFCGARQSQRARFRGLSRPQARPHPR